MKIPWNLILRPDIQEKLNIRLRVFQKPFLWFIACVMPLLTIVMIMGNIHNKRYLDPDKMIRDLCFTGITMLAVIAAVIGLKRPKWLTIGTLVARSFVTLLLCYVQHRLLTCMDPDIEQKELVGNIRRFIYFLYMSLSIFMTPFSDKFFLTFIWSSILFAFEVYWNQSFEEKMKIEILKKYMLMLLLMMSFACYFMRNVFT